MMMEGLTTSVQIKSANLFIITLLQIRIKRDRTVPTQMQFFIAVRQLNIECIV